MGIQLFDHQKRAVELLRPGSILQGGVGSGKSLTALTYFVTKECGGSIQNDETKWKPMKIKKKLFIITTAKKRDDKDWEKESSELLIDDMIVDSWNNIRKYISVKNSFFIFDEQRLIGSGVWVKSFLKIAQHNKWILLTATPGDSWLEYIPVFIANGFYKNRTEFIQKHVVYKRWSKFPSVDYYLNAKRLAMLRDQILIKMRFTRKTISHYLDIPCEYNTVIYNTVMKQRWNVYKNEPLRDASALCQVLRRIINEDESKLIELMKVYNKHNKIIIFYNYNYELNLLENFCKFNKIIYSQWNGHKHEPLPKADKYIYLVQYTAGAEGWNCIESNCIVFFSQNYSYKIMIQAAGRIDRINTKFVDLYYYNFLTTSPIDQHIISALKNKQNFNESKYFEEYSKKHVL